MKRLLLILCGLLLVIPIHTYAQASSQSPDKTPIHPFWIILTLAIILIYAYANRNKEGKSFMGNLAIGGFYALIICGGIGIILNFIDKREEKQGIKETVYISNNSDIPTSAISNNEKEYYSDNNLISKSAKIIKSEYTYNEDKDLSLELTINNLTEKTIKTIEVKYKWQDYDVHNVHAPDYGARIQTTITPNENGKIEVLIPEGKDFGKPTGYFITWIRFSDGTFVGE